MQKISLSLYRTNIIKGLAILAVVLLHILAYPHGIYNSSKQIIFISLDQLSRFCVPAFIMLSGYGLAFKYEHEEINYFSYFKRRIGKLLPLYLLWSLASILIVRSVPAWSFGNQPTSLITQLLLGQADYQLYFLPVIFQLYLIFPLIWKFRKKANLLLIASLIIQAGLYLLYASKLSNSDRYEYVLCLSWIAYFVFGIYLKIKGLPEKIIRLAPIASLLTFALIVLSALKQINAGIDPLPALKFTRLVILPFSLLINLSLITLQSPFNTTLLAGKKIKDLLGKTLAWLGQNSFIIFLSHTVALRIVYAMVTNQLDLGTLMGTIILWVLTLYLSRNFI